MKLKRIGYNKTVVELNNGGEVFYSYDTPVAGRSADYEYFRTEDYYSKTTSRHINNYLEGVNAMVISQQLIDKLAEGLPVNMTSMGNAV